MPPYTHGGDVLTARARFGGDVLDCSANLNPLGMPPAVQAAAAAAAADSARYPDPLCRALRAAIAAYDGVAPEQVLCGGGAAELIFRLAYALRPRRALVTAPAFSEYEEALTAAGCAVTRHPLRRENRFDVDGGLLDAIAPGVELVFLCTPNNPTGAVYSEESLRKLAALAVEHDFFVVADEIYEKLVYDGAEHFSVASISQEVRDRTVTVNGFSKAYAMTGWRIGYAAARADVIKGIMAVQSQTTSATSAISQKAAVEALRGPQHDLEVMVEEFRRRKDYVVDRLNRIPGITCPDVKGAFYVYPDVQLYLGKSFGGRKIETAVELCQYLLDEALISTVPGEAYNVPGKIRISYSNSMENLEKALDRMEQALAALH